MLSLHRIRRCQAIPLVLAITWLPYMSTRCVVNPVTHVGCGVLLAHSYAEARGAHAHAHHGSMATHHDHEDKKAPIHSCCELTGKCNIKVTTSPSSVDAPALVAILAAAIHVPVPESYNLQRGPVVVALAHGPPTYLRNATLRI